MDSHSGSTFAFSKNLSPTLHICEQHHRINTSLFNSLFQDDIPARDKALGRNRARLLKKAEEKRRNDDPYYCGFSARVPQFNNKKVPRERAASRDVVG